MELINMENNQMILPIEKGYKATISKDGKSIILEKDVPSVEFQNGDFVIIRDQFGRESIAIYRGYSKRKYTEKLLFTTYCNMFLGSGEEGQIYLSNIF